MKTNSSTAVAVKANPSLFSDFSISPEILKSIEEMGFKEAKNEKIIYDPITQTTDVFHFGDTGTGGKIGTKSLKSSSTGTGGKAGSGRQDYNPDQKNEIDDSKSKDK